MKTLCPLVAAATLALGGCAGSPTAPDHSDDRPSFACSGESGNCGGNFGGGGNRGNNPNNPPTTAP